MIYRSVYDILFVVLEAIRRKFFPLIRKNWLIIPIVLLALFLRAYGEYPGFPSDHPDEGSGYRNAIYMLTHFLRPTMFAYPAGVPFIHLMIYLNFILPAVLLNVFITEPVSIIKYIFNQSLFFTDYKELIFGPRSIHALYWSRYIGAIIGTGSIVLVYIISKRLFNKTTALFAAFFTAVNFRHVLGSHIGLPDSHNSFFALLSFLASLLLLEKNTRNRYIFAGITIGLSFSMKYHFFAFFPFIFVHFIWFLRKKNFFYLLNRDFILGLFSAFLTFVILNPYYLFNLEEVVHQNSIDYRVYGMGQIGLHPYPFFYLYNWGIGHWPSIAILLGMVLMLFRAPKKFLLLSSFVFPFFFMLTVYSSAAVYPKNFINVIPFLMIFAGYLINYLFNLLKNSRVLSVGASSFIITLLLILINFSSIKNSLTLGYYYSQPWNVTKLGEWLSKSIPSNITTRNYPTFVNFDQIYKRKNITEKMWDYTEGPHSLAEFQEEGTDFAIINLSDFQSITYWWRLRDDLPFFLKYDNVPFDYIENSFFGLSIKELRNYTVFEAYKSWQAQSERNYLVFKIPKISSETGDRITSFTFDSKKDGWKAVGVLEKPQIVGGWISSVGNNTNGALVISGGSGYEDRLVSPPVDVTPNKRYTVKSWFKSEYKGESGERDGFIRLDFYKNKKDAMQAGLGDAVAISSRAFKTGSWEEEQASTVAPKNARYMTVSFQRRSFVSIKGGSDPIYLDDVEVFETTQLPQEKFKEVPYIKSTIPLESIYFNSFF